MAKIPFSKLDAKLNTQVNQVCFCNSKNETISYEVKYYLPIQEKLEMISNIINQSIDGNGYYNPVRLQIFTVLEVVYAYTNLNFTAKQKEDIFKTYDILISSGVFDNVIANIGEKDWKQIQETIIKVVENIYEYRNSILGILEAVSDDYNNLNLDANEIKNTLADEGNLKLLKDVITRLG